MSANGQVKAHESDLRRSWAADEPAMRVKQQVFKPQGIESEEKGSVGKRGCRDKTRRKRGGVRAN